MSESNHSVLLVVDDEPMIVRLIIRSFKNDFDEILYASTPDEAEQLLLNNHVTHFVCDNNLGPGHPAGNELINRWHSMFPELKKVVLFTGMDITTVPLEDGIDVISKTSDPQILLDYLKDSLRVSCIVH